MLKTILFIVSVFLSINIIYSVTITEINFIDEEYVEIESNKFLNFSNKEIFEIGSQKSNKFSLLKYYNSTTYLLVGSSFVSKNNIEKLNCSIYVSDKSQVTNGGLKATGESFIIDPKETNISWIKSSDLSFEEGHSLNIINKTEQILEKSPCLKPRNNIYQNNSLVENNICNISIKSESLFEGKIYFSFETEEKNFSIEYWVEDYFENVVKQKRNTTNTNKKSFTPSFSSAYKIKANLDTEICQNTSEKVVYSVIKSENKIQNSKIKIKNKREFLRDISKPLEIEIYRGDTLKRVVNIKHNSNLLQAIELDKFTSTKIRVLIPNKEGKNKVTISGLGKEEEISFNITKAPENITTNKKYFIFSNINLNNSKVHFSINSSFDFESLCYVSHTKTKVSRIMNLTDSKINILEINQTKLSSKLNSKYDLRLTCKYRKTGLKSFNYIHHNFIYEPNYIEKNASLTFETSVLQNVNDFEKENKSKSEKLKTNISYYSENQNMKSNSFLFIFTGMFLLLVLVFFKREV